MTRILVAEDESQVRQLIKLTLSQQLYKVEEAADGVTAYSMVADAAVAERPDVILLDIILPRLNGFQVLEKLKENPATAYIPVVMVSARNQAQDEMRATRAGAVDYITKPWPAGELEGRVKLVLDARRAAPPTRFTSEERLDQARRSAPAIS